jgi:hypothetical protein
VEVGRERYGRGRCHDRAWLKAAARELNQPWWEQTYFVRFVIACGFFVIGAGLFAVALLDEPVFAIAAVTCWLVGVAALRLWWRTFSGRVEARLRPKRGDLT